VIRAILFDLDGTLVQIEKPKALSYTTAVQRLRSFEGCDARTIEASQEVVGATRDVACSPVMDTFTLEDDLDPLTTHYGITKPRDVLTAVRKAIYDDMVAVLQIIRDNQWPHTIGLLHITKETSCSTAVATVPQLTVALHVLCSLELEQTLDRILTRDDVRNSKRNSEIYLMAADKLAMPPEEYLVLEDSPTRTRATVAAGMNVIAVATPFTFAGLHASEVLAHRWVVHDSEELLNVVQEPIDEHDHTAH
jgi:beta-phosphoglucomutase-like phosphatase (HAD superfamily)